MKHNVIILTTGSSGSSVLAGVIGSQGYWLGAETKKLRFDTYENAELVDLNIEILKASGFNRYDCNDIPPPSIGAIRDLASRIEIGPFNKFIEKSINHSPWLWKDPRLSYTIHFWAQLIEMNSIKFIFITRDPIQSYSGLILTRKMPMSFSQQLTMNQNYEKSCEAFFVEKGIDCFRCIFEDFILDPEKFIQKLNTYLDLKISIKDVKSIYRGRLYKRRYDQFSFLKAKLYYLLYRYIKHDFIRFPRN